ncbi:MAG: translation initiation factor IF-6 [Candidatus Thermoplasmatota archaeon]|nr:translation initiation factor IF-6 [Euryarchaeota archaeon]MBU4032763.1 translation initiation factor IF-6 [Candidatus Thermoplasmatota archaeon]MBU4071499.1 translation initiation factor IF-6 [Candidatus Thermoplasmatota archaeon]MBU4143420.1 translation initiation factor IF-6 [Candidatus Thermoplasmatota archaeon]MBU4592449.1 translation initiation factor IF-6 [Candidatus Thermoplasmatota archaeon]
MLGKAMIFGNPYVGVFCAANENVGLVPFATESAFPDMVKKFLGIEHAIRMSVDGCSTLGALVRMNSNGAVVSQSISEEEVRKIGRVIKVTKIAQRHNAMGNNVLANDNGALVHPEFDDRTIDLISKALKVPVERGTIAGYSTVGSSAVATNKGIICHPHTSSYEMEIMEQTLGVKAQLCTANYGTGQVGACMIANTKGALVGETTTPIELGKVEEGLVLY